jgi:hypothetical protein
MDVELPILIRRQPDYTTCGPTSLHAVIRARRGRRKGREEARETRDGEEEA